MIYVLRTLAVVHRSPIEAQKVFRRAIRIGWRGKKFSAGPSESDGGKKRFPRVYPNRMEVKKVFHGSIRIGWRGKKFSAGPSESDGGEKSFPRVYPNRMETRKTSEALSMDDGIKYSARYSGLIYNKRQLRLSWLYNVNLLWKLTHRSKKSPALHHWRQGRVNIKSKLLIA